VPRIGQAPHEDASMPFNQFSLKTQISGQTGNLIQVREFRK
jgi:hypothetical protein